MSAATNPDVKYFLLASESSIPSTLDQSEPRHVHFQENVTVIPPSYSWSSIDAENDASSSWYQLKELDAFRNDAREI